MSLDFHWFRKQFFSLTLLIILSPFLAVIAQDTRLLTNLSFDDLMDIKIITASKQSESPQDAPGVITVVTHEEILGLGLRNLGQVLEQVVGMHFLSANVFQDNIISLRGQSLTPYNNHILILVNGRPLRDPISGGLNSPVYTTFPMALIDRLEIIRGPGSVLYGSCAFSGVVNIITRHNPDARQNALTVSGGGQGHWGAEFSSVRCEVGPGISIGITHYEKEGPLYRFTDMSGVEDEARFKRSEGSLFLCLNQKDWSGMVFWGAFEPYALEGGGVTWDHDNAMENNSHKTLFANIGRSIKLSGAAQLQADVTYNQHKWIRGGGRLMQARSGLAELSAQLTPLVKLPLTLGATLEYNHYKGPEFIDGSDWTGALYFQGKYIFNESFSTVLGLQVNKPADLDAHLSPRLGLIGKLTEALGFKALFSSAFRRAYPLETSFDHPLFQGNLALTPEVITTTEGQLYYQKSRIRIAATLFHSHLNDIITRNWTVNNEGQDQLQYQNDGSRDYWGIEFESQVKPNSFWMMNFNTSYQLNRDKNDVENIALHPNLMIKTAVYLTPSMWDIGLSLSHHSTPHAVSTVVPDVASPNPEAKAATMVNLHISRRITFQNSHRWIQWKLTLQNLLDQDIRYPEYTSRGINTLLPLSAGLWWHSSMVLHF